MPLTSRPWLWTLVRWRHPLLLTFVLLETWFSRSATDWTLLTGGARSLFGPMPLSLYETNKYLQAGPPGLVAVRVVDLLPAGWGESVTHTLLAVLGWYLLWQTERWSVPKADSGTVPLKTGLRTLALGMPVLQVWAFLAGGAPHLEDGLTILTFVLATRAVGQGRSKVAAIVVGLTAAWKPWGVVALPLLWGLNDKRRALFIGLAIPAACWLPFLLADQSTLHAVSYGFPLQPNSTLRVLGLGASHVAPWWRSVELAGALCAASVAAIRRDWRVAFAAGCTARLLLDPAGFDYYVAGLILVTALTERVAGLRPWRTILLTLAMVQAQLFVEPRAMAPLRFFAMAVVLVSWLHPWRSPRSRFAGSRPGEQVVTNWVPAQSGRELMPVHGAVLVEREDSSF